MNKYTCIGFREAKYIVDKTKSFKCSLDEAAQMYSEYILDSNLSTIDIELLFKPFTKRYKEYAKAFRSTITINKEIFGVDTNGSVVANGSHYRAVLNADKKNYTLFRNNSRFKVISSNDMSLYREVYGYCMNGVDGYIALLIYENSIGIDETYKFIYKIYEYIDGFLRTQVILKHGDVLKIGNVIEKRSSPNTSIGILINGHTYVEIPDEDSIFDLGCNCNDLINILKNNKIPIEYKYDKISSTYIDKNILQSMIELLNNLNYRFENYGEDLVIEAVITALGVTDENIEGVMQKLQITNNNSSDCTQKLAIELMKENNKGTLVELLKGTRAVKYRLLDFGIRERNIEFISMTLGVHDKSHREELLINNLELLFNNGGYKSSMIKILLSVKEQNMRVYYGISNASQSFVAELLGIVYDEYWDLFCPRLVKKLKTINNKDRFKNVVAAIFGVWDRDSLNYKYPISENSESIITLSNYRIDKEVHDDTRYYLDLSNEDKMYLIDISGCSSNSSIEVICDKVLETLPTTLVNKLKGDTNIEKAISFVKRVY